MAAKTQPAKLQNYNIADSGDMKLLANELAKFIKENKLYHNIQGKEYVNIEGWQYAGARAGIIPVVKDLVNVGTEAELKYQAKVELLNLDTNIICGAGFAVCSNKEQGKKYYQEFAIASMAQTRAVGKAFRNVLAYLIRAAGYEATPAEEMDYGGNMPEIKPDTVPGQRLTPKADAPAGLTQPAKDVPVITGPAGNDGSIKYATAKQKETLIRLLNNPVITRQEKTKMLLNINKLDQEIADKVAEKIKKIIEEREEQSAAAN